MKTITQQDITAVILAGGQARRMQGQDKGLLKYQGQHFIQHLVQGLSSQVSHIIVNANRNQQQYAELTQCPVISDSFGHFAGPLAGMLTGLQTAQTPYVLFLPCDVPFVPDFLVSRLAHVLANSQAHLCTVDDGQRTQYLFALMRRDVQDHLHTYLKQDKHQVKAWYQQQHVMTADFADCPQYFANINTPADLQNITS